MNAKMKPEDERRQKQRVFRVTDKEYEEIETLAELYGYANPTEFIRRAALGYQPVDRKILDEKGTK